MQLSLNGETPNLTVFDVAKRYRYSLSRRIRPSGERRCLFVMLNPSTADEWELDPTVRRCVGYAQSWGYDWLDVANIFAWRATDPYEMLKVADPIGEGNDAAILKLAWAVKEVICAWGIHGGYKGRGAAVRKMLVGAGIQPKCLGLTASGEPKHPLYLRADLKPMPLEVI